MTTIQTIIFQAAMWMPRERPARAVMPIQVVVERRTSALVPDLCWACRPSSCGLDAILDGTGRDPGPERPRGFTVMPVCWSLDAAVS